MRATRPQLNRLGGQTVVEVIVALAVLLTAVTGALTLTAAALRAQTDNEGWMVATNLAREGIEVARSIRDSNWLADLPWDQGLVGEDDDYTGIPEFDPDSGDWSINFEPSDAGSASTQVWRFVEKHVGLYVQRPKQPKKTVATRFYRLLTLQAVCQDGSIKSDGGACSILNPKVAVRIRSRVDWLGAGRRLSLTIEETMYDWR